MVRQGVLGAENEKKAKKACATPNQKQNRHSRQDTTSLANIKESEAAHALAVSLLHLLSCLLVLAEKFYFFQGGQC